jgi:anhydro-N-acetylmuramic acid kinase
MSGTSMDGLDIVLAKFEEEHGKWSFTIDNCKTYSYPDKWIKTLSNSKDLSGLDLMIADKDLGTYFGERVLDFMREFGIKKSQIDFIASHGHTVFHQPEINLTTQIGCGENIAYTSGIPVINDFRTKNVLAGGQGAPLVPVGDRLLFSEYDACVNIGGFCNISVAKGSQMVAYDVCPGNLPLNIYAQREGHVYDHNGQMARKGELDSPLLQHLNNLPYYKQSPPKSLGTEWLDEQFLKNINDSLSTENILRTITEHIATQLASAFEYHNVKDALITGGGAKNNLLIELLRSKTSSQIIVPKNDIIDFKEALIFGFLGVLYALKAPNSLASVTGSKEDIIGGVFHLP